MATVPSPYVATAPHADQPSVPAAEHEATIVEKGSFARAVCATCDWRGPARRARAFAAGDIEEHRLLAGQPDTIDLRDPA
jgi:hypothetical protein